MNLVQIPARKELDKYLITYNDGSKAEVRAEDLAWDEVNDNILVGFKNEAMSLLINMIDVRRVEKIGE